MEEKGGEQKERDGRVKPMFKLIPKCRVREPNISFHILPWLPGSSKPPFLFCGAGLARPGFAPVETRAVSGSQAAPSSHAASLPGRLDISSKWQEVGLSGSHNPEPSKRPAAWKARAEEAEAHRLRVWPRVCDVSLGEAPVSASLASFLFISVLTAPWFYWTYVSAEIVAKHF